MQDDPDDPDDPYDTHDQSLPVVTQETSDGGRPLFQAYVEAADESGDELARGDSASGEPRRSASPSSQRYSKSG